MTKTLQDSTSNDFEKTRGSKPRGSGLHSSNLDFVAPMLFRKDRKGDRLLYERRFGKVACPLFQSGWSHLKIRGMK